MSESAQDVLKRVLALVRRFGREATSFQVLEPGLAYWFCDDDAVVAYADVGAAWVSAGEPVCAAERLPEVVARFRDAARAHGKRVRFFHVSAALAAQPEVARTHVGELPVWDARHWAETLKGTRSLREQLRRARAKGVRVRMVDARELGDADAPLRRRCEQLVHGWLRGRGMSELKFMVKVHPFGFAEERRFAVAEQNGEVVGLGVAIPIYQRRGWFIEDLIRHPRAPSGTAESLVDALMRVFAEQGSRYVTLGLAPLAGEVRPLLALTRNYTARLYNFPGVRSFKEKLRPKHWDPIYLVYPRGELGLVAMADVLSAFAPAGVVRFGLETLIHQRTLATQVLAVLLVPWTVAVFRVDTATWFPSATVQLAWVALDVVLIGLMLSLVRRWRARVAEIVAVLTTLDALLTAAQVLLWNVWTTRTLAAWALVLLGCAGPLLAATFFWSARRVEMRGHRKLS